MLNCCTTCISWEIGSYNTQQSRHTEHTHFCRNFVAKSATWFSKNEEGGSKAVWNFSENSSVLIPWPVRGKRFNHWKTKQLFLKLVVICNSQERYRWHNVLQRMTSVTHVSLSASAPHAWFCWHIDHCPSTMSVHLLPQNVSFSCPWEQRLSMKSGQRAWKDLLSHGLKE